MRSDAKRFPVIPGGARFDIKNDPERLITALVFILSLLWILDVYVKDAARVLFVAAGAAMLFRGSWPSAPIKLAGRHNVITIALIAVYFFSLLSGQVLGVYLGTHGIDFAIYCQVIDSVSRHGGLFTSLVDAEWMNFVTHHFSPILYAPGSLGFLGIPAYLIGPLFHFLCVALAAHAFYEIGRALGFGRALCLFFLLLTLFNPSFMKGLLWDIHAEIFALPFIGYAFLFWLKKRHWLAALMVALSTTAKESLFLFAIVFAAMALADAMFFKSNKMTKNFAAPYLLVGGWGLASFIGYFFMQPLLFGKEFDHFSKLASPEIFFRPDILFAKAWFVVFLFLPVLAFPLWGWRSALTVAPAAPFVAIILVSGFDEMFKPMNYYAVVPTYLIYISALIGLKTRYPQWQKAIPAGLYLLLLLSVFSFAQMKPMKTFKQAFREPWLMESQLAAIPDSATVVVSNAAAPLLYRCAQLRRLWSASRTLPDFDYIVSAVKEPSPVGAGLTSRSRRCLPSDRWNIRCATGGMVKR